jgi:hypothetical protein
MKDDEKIGLVGHHDLNKREALHYFFTLHPSPFSPHASSSILFPHVR